MYRQLLIVGVVAGASLTAGGIAAVWTTEKSPAALYGELGHKLKPIVRSILAASWNDHGRAEVAALVHAPGSGRGKVSGAVPPPADGVAVAPVVAAAQAAPGSPHCASSAGCVTGGGFAQSTAAPPAVSGRRPMPLVLPAPSVPGVSGGAPAPAVAAAPAAPAALAGPAPAVTMLLADTSPAGSQVVEGVEYGHSRGPRDVAGQAQVIPDPMPQGVAPDSYANPLAEPLSSVPMPDAARPLLSGTPAATPAAGPEQPAFKLPSGTESVPELLAPTGTGPNAPVEALAVGAAEENVVAEPSTNVLLLAAVLGAAVLVRRRVP